MAHNATFDVGFLAADIIRTGHIPPAGPVLDTRGMAKRAFPARSSYSLENLTRDLRLEAGMHRALADAHACRELFLRCRTTLGEDASPSALVAASGPVLDLICHVPPLVDLAINLAGAMGTGSEVRIEYRSSQGKITVRDIRPLAFSIVGGSICIRADCRLRGGAHLPA